MRTGWVWLAFGLSLLWLAPAGRAQTPAPPVLAVPEAGTLEISPTEQQFFEFGYALTKAAYATVEVVKRAGEKTPGSGHRTQTARMANLAPLARKDHALAGASFAQALVLLSDLRAPVNVLTPIAQAAAHFAKPISPTSEAPTPQNDALQTLLVLGEFNDYSTLPELPALHHWLASPAVARSSQVWYAEGEMAALLETASARQMPSLLPPAHELATDLRGLRDWLVLRLPDAPTPEQAALKSGLDDFIQQTTLKNPGGKPASWQVTPTQLQSLGVLSQQLQAQVLGPSTPATLPPPLLAE